MRQAARTKGALLAYRLVKHSCTSVLTCLDLFVRVVPQTCRADFAGDFRTKWKALARRDLAYLARLRDSDRLVAKPCLGKPTSAILNLSKYFAAHCAVRSLGRNG